MGVPKTIGLGAKHFLLSHHLITSRNNPVISGKKKEKMADVLRMLVPWQTSLLLTYLRQAFIFCCAYTKRPSVSLGDAVWIARQSKDWIFFQFLLKSVQVLSRDSGCM